MSTEAQRKLALDEAEKAFADSHWHYRYFCDTTYNQTKGFTPPEVQEEFTRLVTAKKEALLAWEAAETAYYSNPFKV